MVDLLAKATLGTFTLGTVCADATTSLLKMRIPLPTALHYPFTVKRIHKQVGDKVNFKDTLFSYTYIGTVKQQVSRYDDEEIEVQKTLYASFQSTLEGVVDKWFVWENDVVKEAKDVVALTEDCKHSVVYNGMCTECGKDMTG